MNFSPVALEEYRFGVPDRAAYEEVFNTDALCWGGSGVCNEGDIPVEKIPSHDRETSVSVRIPPLGALYLQGKSRINRKKGAEKK